MVADDGEFVADLDELHALGLDAGPGTALRVSARPQRTAPCSTPASSSAPRRWSRSAPSPCSAAGAGRITWRLRHVLRVMPSRPCRGRHVPCDMKLSARPGSPGRARARRPRGTDTARARPRPADQQLDRGELNLPPGATRQSAAGQTSALASSGGAGCGTKNVACAPGLAGSRPRPLEHHRQREPLLEAWAVRARCTPR